MAFQEKPLGQNCGGMGGFKPSRALRVALKLDSLRFSLRFEARAWRTSAGVLSTGSRWDFLVEMSDPRRPVTPPGRLCCPRAARMWLHPMGWGAHRAFSRFVALRFNEKSTLRELCPVDCAPSLDVGGPDSHFGRLKRPKSYGFNAKPVVRPRNLCLNEPASSTLNIIN